MADLVLDSPLVESIGRALLHFVWQGTVIGVATAVAMGVLAGARPTTRYAVACLSLTLMLIVPVVAVLADRSTVSASVAMVTIAATAGASSLSMDRVLPVAVVVWLAGVILLSIRLAAAWIAVERLKRVTREVDHAVTARVQWLANRFGITRPVRVFESRLVHVPTMAGYVRPVILLPASVITGLAPAYLDAVLAHELAHVRRHDYLVNALQSLVETLLFYHPAVWWCSRQIRIEREHCCDDMVVEVGGDPVRYATALAHLEELRGPEPMFSLNASGGRLVDRIRRLLKGSAMKERQSTTWTIAAALAVVTVIIMAPGRSVMSASSVAVTAEVDYPRLQPQPAPQPQAQPTTQTTPQPAPRARVQPRPQPGSQPETQATPQPPQPPSPAPPAPPRPPDQRWLDVVVAPLAPAPPLPPNPQVAVPVPAPPAPPAPPLEPLGLDADSIQEAMRGAMEQISASLEELRRATEEVTLKQEAIRQAQAEIAKMRVESLANQAQIDALQKAINELREQLGELRAR